MYHNSPNTNETVTIQREAALDAHESIFSALAELQDSAGSGRRAEAQGSSDANHLVVHTCSETS